MMMNLKRGLLKGSMWLLLLARKWSLFYSFSQKQSCWWNCLLPSVYWERLSCWSYYRIRVSPEDHPMDWKASENIWCNLGLISANKTTGGWPDFFHSSKGSSYQHILMSVEMSLLIVMLLVLLEPRLLLLQPRRLLQCLLILLINSLSLSRNK